MNAINTSLNVRDESCEWSVTARTDAEIRRLVSDILESTGPHTMQGERRSDQRVAYPYLLTLTPVANGDTVIPVGEPIDVVGKCLAERGLTFFHTQNLPFRRAVVTFNPQFSPPAHLILNISWSRFLRPGWYDSGGRFTHVLQELNVDSDADEARQDFPE